MSEPSSSLASMSVRPPSIRDVREWLAATIDRLRHERGLAAIAAGAALASLAFVILGGAPAAQLGSGLGRFAGFGVVALTPLIAGLLVASPWEGLLAWLVIMPVLLLARVQVFVGAVQLTLSTILIAALAAGWLMQRRRQRATDRLGAQPAASPRLRWAWPVAGLVATLALASAIASPDTGGSLSIALHGVVEPAVLAAIVLSLRPDRARLLWLGAAMGSSVALASVYSLSRVGKLAGTLAEVVASRADLAHLTYYNVGIYGDMLAMAIPLLVVVLIVHRRIGLPWWAFALLALGLVVSLVGLYATFSKSAWVGSLAAVAAVILLVLRTWRARMAAAAVGLVLAALIVPYPVYLLRLLGQPVSADNPYLALISSVQGARLSSWNPDTTEGEVSISERFLATEAAFRMAADHPILGVGPGQFGAQYQTAAYHQAAATRALGSAHDFLPDVAAEYGLPMAVLVLLALVTAGVSAANAALRRTGLERFVATAFGAALLAFVIVGLTFGVDLYRVYRVMNADVLFAGLIIAACISLAIPMPGAGPGAPVLPTTGEA